MTTLQKLLKYPHKDVFDTSPHDGIAFKLRNPLGDCSWVISDDVMLVSNGLQTFTYSLPDLSIPQLIFSLQTDGFEVSSISNDFLNLNSTVLVEANGDQDSYSFVSAFKNLLYAFLGAYGKELRAAQRQSKEAIRQMVITDAEGEWLDLWGNLYNHKRTQDQSDQSYSTEIPKEAFRVRVNALAIEKAIFDETGKKVIIEEPWGSMFRLDDSALSGTKKLYNGERVGYHLLRPVSSIPIDWSDVLPVIYRNKASGIIVLDPEVRPGSFIDASVNGTCWLGVQNRSATLIKSINEGVLSENLTLSGDARTRNYHFAITSNGTYANGRYITWSDGAWDDRPWNEFLFENPCPESISSVISQRLGYTWIESGIWDDINWLGN